VIRLLPLLAAALSLADTGRAQRARAVVPLGGPGAIETPTGDAGDDVGVNVELFENPNLDRYLRKAQGFLAAENYLGAIQVLQDVIEGRTVESSSVEPEAPPPEAGGGKPADAKPGTDSAPKPAVTAPRRAGRKPAGAEAEPGPKAPPRPLDPAQTVFSQDGRLYRPVRRLCHELLATMPAQGIELYRTNYEVAAEHLLQTAIASGEASQFELVGNRYFATVAAGRAMLLLADQLMHQGRYRAAVQVLRDLVEVYPAENRMKLGVSEVWCQFKIALCIRLAGEVDVARERAAAMARKWSDESLRIMGELHAVKDLPDEAPFHDAARLIDTGSAPRADSRTRWLATADEPLLPLWQFRYQTAAPYGTIKSTRQNQATFGVEGITITAQPPATKYGTHTSMAFFGGAVPDRVVFYDHYRLRVADAFTGIQLQENAGSVDMSKPMDGRPRLRVPVYDYGLLRPAADGDRWFAIEGATKSPQSIEAARANRILAHERGSMNKVWSSDDWSEGEDGLREVAFLAAPTVFGARLLVPVLRRNAYSLQCLDAATGRPLWCTPIHAGGSQFHKAPGTPVAVVAGIAYVLTNAGCLAAVDAFAGDLRWIRRYERRDPRLPPRKAANRGRAERFTGNQLVERDLAHHLPSDLITTEGLVIFAPCDGDVLLCLDGSSGEPVWLIESDSSYAPYGRLQCLVGANSRFLFAATETDLVCIGLRSGVRLWSQQLSTDQDLTRWRGRGTVLEDAVLMPGAREVLIYDAEGRQAPRRAALPPFAIGPEPLRGPNAVFAAGPWLGVAYQGGLEVYSSATALKQLAATSADPLTRASYLVMAGEPEAAIDSLILFLESAPPADRQKTASKRLLGYCRERALELAAAGRPQDGAALLDRVLPHATDRSVRMNWHLARLDLWQQVGDLHNHEEEQQRLYRYIEGRR
jgi:outer membrane protein assembly factor BamB